MQAFNSIFVLDEVEIENLEDGTIPIIDMLKETFKKLHIENELLSENKDYNAFVNYLENLANSKAR